jgi:hypothetical protein
MQIARTVTYHLLEWPKSKTMAASNDVKDMEQLEVSVVAIGNAMLEKSFLQICSYHTILGIYPKTLKTCAIWKPEHRCPQWPWSQWPKLGSRHDVFS